MMRRGEEIRGWGGGTRVRRNKGEERSARTCAGVMQRSAVVLVLGIHVNVAREQRVHQLLVPIEAGQMQRRVTVRAPRVWVDGQSSQHLWRVSVSAEWAARVAEDDRSAMVPLVSLTKGRRIGTTVIAS